jgi:hypothetical protein
VSIGIAFMAFSPSSTDKLLPIRLKCRRRVAVAGE